MRQREQFLRIIVANVARRGRGHSNPTGAINASFHRFVGDMVECAGQRPKDNSTGERCASGVLRAMQLAKRKVDPPHQPLPVLLLKARRELRRLFDGTSVDVEPEGGMELRQLANGAVIIMSISAS